MPRTCTVCSHAARQQVELALISGRAIRDIAGQFDLSKTALDRHRHEHLLDDARAVVVRRTESRGHALLDEADALLGKASELLLSAEASGDTRTALTGVREARSCIELLAKLQPTGTGSVIIDAESVGLDAELWLVVCNLLRDVLAGWHSLADTVGNGLRDLGLDNAAEVVLSSVPELLRSPEREPVVTSLAVIAPPTRTLTVDDLAAIARVINEELADFPGLRQRMRARLAVIEADLTCNRGGLR
jgi:hypothetical protein